MKPVDMQTLLDRMAELLGLEWLYEPEQPRRRARRRRSRCPSIAAIISTICIGSAASATCAASTQSCGDGGRHPSNKPLATRLRALVANFELKRYMNVLEAMRKNG